MQDGRTLAELAQESGIPARTIRFYISRNLLDRPVKGGRGAVYTAEHLARLEEIRALQAEGRTLTEIASMLGGTSRSRSGPAATAWWQYTVADDVVVWARADVSPWRMKQIRAAIDEMLTRLGPDEAKRRNL